MSVQRDFTELLEMFAAAPDRQLSEKLALKCRDFLNSGDTDHVRFLRTIRDLCVRYGDGSGFVMAVLNTVLMMQDEETEEQMTQRRAEISAAENEENI